MLRVISLEHLQAQKDLGSTFLCLSVHVRRDATGWETRRPISLQLPPLRAVLKLALFLPIAPFSFFLFATQRGKGEGVRGVSSVRLWDQLSETQGGRTM